MRLAAASLLKNPRRSVLTTLALANAVAGGLMFYGFTRDTFWGLAESFARGGNGHIQVADRDWFDSPSPEQHRVARGVLAEVQRAVTQDAVVGPDILASTLRRNIMGMVVGADGRSGVFLGVGTDPDTEALIAPLALPLSGVPISTAAPLGVVIGEPLAGRLGVETSGVLTALVTTDAGMTNGQDLSVVGLARTGAEELDRTFVSLPLDAALGLVDSDRVDVLVIALRQTEETDSVLASVQAILSQAHPSLEARPWYTRANYYVAVRALYDRIFGVFEALMAVVTILSLTHAVSAVVAERSAEIAMLRVVGLRRRDVAALFVVEGALLGVLGCVGGAGLAMVASMAVAAMGGIPMPPPPGFSMGYAAQIRVDAVGLAVVLSATFGASVLASAIPAWRATRGALSGGLMR